MDSLAELVHTCLGVLGCGCLDDEFWQSRRSRRHDDAASPLAHPRPQSFRGEDLLETLLRTPPPEPSRASMDDLGQQLQRGASSSSEELYRAASFNTKVGVLRSQSPFYRMQEPPGVGPSSASARPGSAAAAAAGGAAAAAATEGIELKPASANVLLGQAHLEGRGKFLPAHPVRRGASPLQRAGSPDAG
ncbi:hypothetical protein C2E21_5711 [Chlorella sorokiniana]|uniref:Uncharacterized protein n=1 Tax=Chlorella sorokiniana TaxID=3076 RepID=A0A2P6TM31_CHLSO|nr:hypothetical protein C2E21_5711 [Chlorella sorokiniana]|eukprot:PRW45355.1 hypothetical protein C2E21_5711 [Chlorella sorokiniana]